MKRRSVGRIMRRIMATDDDIVHEVQMMPHFIGLKFTVSN